MGLISLSEYADKNGLKPDTVRQKALRGKYKSAKKIGRNWVIDDDEPNIDNRIKSGKFINFRKK